MAGGKGDLETTPTWAVALVCAVMIIISLLLEKSLHHIGEWFRKKNKGALGEALEKVKSELMILGFISLLISFFQNNITQICIPEYAGKIMLPCRPDSKNDTKKGRQLLWTEIMDFGSNRRILAGGPTNVTCPDGQLPLMSKDSLHDVHLFIFFLAVVHVVYSASAMAFGVMKINSWKEWENETLSIDYEFSTDPSRFRFARETTFVQHHASFGTRRVFILYIVSFFRQFIRSVKKTDYFTLRHGFINAHLNPGMKFNFQKYIRRSLDDDFKVVVGISPILWACGVIILLLNIDGLQQLFWVTLLPLVVSSVLPWILMHYLFIRTLEDHLLILAIGTKLQAIIATMALEIQQRHSVIQGMPIVKLSDHHFWFGRPRLVLFLIHFTMFVNTFQLTHFLWIWSKFKLDTCFHENFGFVIARISIGVTVHIICSYVTLPLYALVSQMGSHIKKSIFDERTSNALKKWHDEAKKRHKKGNPYSQNVTPSPSPGQSPIGSQRSCRPHQYTTMGDAGISFRKPQSDNEFLDGQIEMPVARSELSHHDFQHELRLNMEHRRDESAENDFSFAKPDSRK